MGSFEDFQPIMLLETPRVGLLSRCLMSFNALGFT